MIGAPIHARALLGRTALAAAIWTAALLVAALLLEWLGAGAPVCDGLGDVGLRAEPQGLASVCAILARNLPVAAVAIGAAWTVPRCPRWRAAADLYVLATAGLSLLTGAAALAALGTALIRYAIPFAPLEIAGFALAGSVYWTYRCEPPAAPRQLALATAAVAGLLTVAAVAEARWGGVL